VVYGGSCRIGVLGGIGPEATAEFYSKLIKRMQDQGLVHRNEDFPQVFVNSIPAPELIHDNISDKDLEPYVKGLRELDSLNPDFAVMVCNTIHLFYEMLQGKVNMPIIDLRKEVEKCLKKRGIKKALVIGTPYTLRLGLYRFKGIEHISPDEKETKALSECIHFFNKGCEKSKQTDKASAICRKYLQSGAEVTIMGCTEFAVMLGKEDFSKLDTIDVLVEATMNRVKESFK
jgi:aspartate racemase